MQSRLDSISEELQKFKLQTQLNSKRIRELNAEKNLLTTRMRDQDEELKGKAKLLEVRRRLDRCQPIILESSCAHRMFMMRTFP